MAKKVLCGNYDCQRNHSGTCLAEQIAIDKDGKCVLVKPWNKNTTKNIHDEIDEHTNMC